MSEGPRPIKFGYVRVSTDDQRLELQTDALVKAGVDADRIFSDKASGATVDRPGFIAMFKALRAGDTLVVWKLDRLGRNLSQLLQTAERLDAKGCKLLVVTDARVILQWMSEAGFMVVPRETADDK